RRGRLNAATRSPRELRLCFRLSARYARRCDERKLPHGRRGWNRLRRRNPALSVAQRLRVNGPPRTIVLSANSDWDVANFRGGLIRGPRRAGYGPVVLAS